MFSFKIGRLPNVMYSLTSDTKNKSLALMFYIFGAV